MTHTLTGATAIDLHRVGTEGDLHALLVGGDGPHLVGPRAGLESLYDAIGRYLDSLPPPAEDDDRRPSESEAETLGGHGWDHPSRGPA